MLNLLFYNELVSTSLVMLNLFQHLGKRFRNPENISRTGKFGMTGNDKKEIRRK